MRPGGTNLCDLGDLRRGSQTPWPYDAYSHRLDHAIAVNERQLRRVVRSYVDYFHRAKRIWGSKRTHRKSDPPSFGKWGRLSRIPVWVGCTTATHGSCEMQRRPKF
jgi:hypothetical protein